MRHGLAGIRTDWKGLAGKLKSLLIPSHPFSSLLFPLLISSLVIGHSSLAYASPGIYISSPADKMITSRDVIVLSGAGKNLAILKVNGRQIKVGEKGKFSCGLVLHLGKNFIEVKAKDRSGKTYLKKLHILRLASFPDLEGHWAQKKIIYLATLGFIEGYPDGYFYAGQPLTRGELATWLARIKKLYPPYLAKDPFLDVPKEHWRAPAIAAVTKKKYIKGITSKHFGIDEPISRDQAAYIATKAENVKVLWEIKKLIFQDVPKEESLAPPIFAAKKKGLVVGVSKKVPLFDPYRNITRAEAVILLSRFDRAKKAIQYLLNFKQGFDREVYAKVNVAPRVESFTVDPPSIYVNAEYVIKLRAKISSRKGFYPISKVKVDLSSLGGLPDAEMFDDGTFGDETANDGTYSLNLKLTVAESGERALKATAIDTLGWEGTSSAKLWVVK